jgi:hypothetical protein
MNVTRIGLDAAKNVFQVHGVDVEGNVCCDLGCVVPHGPRRHDGTIIPETVDTMWGTDLTTTITGQGLATVFIAIDHCSAECVGIHAAPRATRFEADGRDCKPGYFAE